MPQHPTFESGYELDRLFGRESVRWWLYLHVPLGRAQRPRLGVIDNGFRFARGGRSDTVGGALEALELARGVARTELGYWQRQPSHALGPNGELVPLGPVMAELEPTEKAALEPGENNGA